MLVSSLFWGFTQCWLVVVYRGLGAVKRSDYLTAEEMGPTGSAKTSVNNSSQHRVKTQKSKFSNFTLVKKGTASL